MSMYASYLKEHSGDSIIETDFGFVTYRFINDKQVYIIDVYVEPEFRKQDKASDLANMVAEIAKQSGHNQMLGTVVPSLKNSADSMKVLLAYGMTPFAIDGNMVVFRRDI